MAEFLSVLNLICCVLCCVISSGASQTTTTAGPSVISNEDSYLTGVQGFGADIQCIVNSCLKNMSRLKWYKDDFLIAEGTEVYGASKKVEVIHHVKFHTSKDCTETSCSAIDPCDDGQHCLGNNCCHCESEEFTLVLKNLTLQDSGTYRCDLDKGRENLEFAFEVYESGIVPGFNKNLTFDHSECCETQGMSKKCQPLCKPFVLETHKFDPMDCDSEIGKFFHCVTEGGNVSHVHCCRLQLVPPFCWDFCSGDLRTLREAHHLCLFWLPEIMDCYEHAYLPLPEPPESVIIDSLDHQSMKVCWDPPTVQRGKIQLYTVQYKEVPRFPFFGAQSGSPFVPSQQVQSSIADPIRTAVEMEDPYDEPRAKRVSRFDAWQEEEGEEDFDTETSLSFADENVKGYIAFRRKRGTWVIFTHNGVTNETRVKEFKFIRENTTETCHVVKNLQPATQYIVYVTATNEYGTSLPSVRSIVATPAVLQKNGTLPQIAQCCKTNGVEPECIPKVCDLQRTPSPFGALDIALNCRTEFSGVAPCLADGRDHTPCCRSRGVTGECLKLCDGTAKYLGLQSVLCLTLDMHAVYSCIRQGYVTHPSPPRNLSLSEIRTTSVLIKWQPPATNAENVQNYSLILRNEDRPNVGIIEMKNVTSPYELIGLEPATTYLVFLVAHGKHGSSLRSVVEEFDTLDFGQSRSVCSFGDALRGPQGENYYCSESIPCPDMYECVQSLSGAESFCCPTGAPPTPLPESKIQNVTECCMSRGMVGKCKQLCSYNTTLQQLFTYGSQCIHHIKTWVDCGSDGRDHRPCCMGRGVPEVCLVFCHPPLRALDRKHVQCMLHAETILQCGAEGILKLPGPPKSLRVSKLISDSVKLTWDPPHQAPEVKFYRVVLYFKGSLFAEKNVTGLSVEFSGLRAGDEYTGQAFSHNQHGRSISSNNVSFSPPPNSGDIESPKAPHTVQVPWNKLDSANLTWEWDGRTNGGRPITNASFTVFFTLVNTSHPQPTQSVSTKNMWVEIRPLERNKYYNVCVVALDEESKKQSGKSENITFTTISSNNPPSIPLITLSPRKRDYTVGEEIQINCSSTGTIVPTVTLSGIANLKNATGKGFVLQKVTASKELSRAPITCKADDGYGKKSIRHRNIPVLFGPDIVRPAIETLKVVDMTRAELECKVEANPTPSVTWQFKTLHSPKEPSRDLKSSENITVSSVGFMARRNLYRSTLQIREVFTFNAGYYSCKACNKFGCATQQYQLIVQTMPLPPGPTVIKECCEKQGVVAECRSACTYEIDMNAYDNNPVCMREFPKLLYCAKNGIDHTACCIKNNVEQDCLGLCDLKIGDVSQGQDFIHLMQRCGTYNKHVFHCVLEAQRQIPSRPKNVRTQIDGDSALTVSWDLPEHNGESVKTYAVYYKPEREHQYQIVRTGLRRQTTLRNLKPSTTYDVSVLAGNTRGFSEFSVSQKVTLRGRQYKSSARSTAGAVLGIIFCMLLTTVIILSVIWFTRTTPYRLPAFFSKLRGGHGSSGCTVAFENPGYDREGQIRGLPGDRFTGDGIDVPVLNGGTTVHEFSNGKAGWESADLEAPNDSGSAIPLQKGLRYTQLSSSK